MTEISEGCETVKLTWGPFKVPGIWGIAVNVLSCLYIIIILFFSFWPPATPVVASTMNYSCLVFGAVIIFSVIYYLLIAHKYYIGPIVEVGTKEKTRGG